MILVIGKNGQVGFELCRSLSILDKLHCIDYPEIDLCDVKSIRRVIQEVHPKVIVNAAAYTNVDGAEDNEEEALAINGIAPGIIAEEADRIGALMVHYSTDYVFNGRKDVPYTEEDKPNPLNYYGRSKLIGDMSIQEVSKNYLILRLCWVYGNRGKNFMLTMLRLQREGKPIKVVCDQFGSPTWSRLIAEATAFIVSKYMPEKIGIYNVSCSGYTNWNRFASEILGSNIEAISTKDYPTKAKRPKYSVLDCHKLKSQFGITLPNWKDTLRMVLPID